MWFGELDTKDAEGAVLAHALKLPSGKRIAKGRLLTGHDVSQILDADIPRVIVAKLAGGDVAEDEAAMAVAKLFERDGIRLDRAGTGRVNFYAERDGLLWVDANMVNQINSVDPSITLATLDNHVPVNAGRMVGTVKIIPYAVAGESISRVLAVCDDAVIARIVPYSLSRVGVISTLLPSLKDSVVDKTMRILQKRLQPAGATITRELRVSHDADQVSAAVTDLKDEVDMIILFGASAICDINDVIPEAIRRNGGEITRFGMPVDPGNLMLLAKIGDLPVIGAPGCARSPAENGFDWVLARTLAGLEIGNEAIAGMGVGGLLMEIGTRPQPREPVAPREKARPGIKTTGIILAAGQSRRMGAVNKLAARLWDKALVRHVAEAAGRSDLDSILVVTGHEAERVRDLLDGISVSFVHNPAFEEGLSSSLKAGISALDGDVGQAMILLGDMPFVTHEMINQVLEKARSSNEGSGVAGNIVMASNNGKRGNPVLWPRAYFDELTAIEGDVGARHIIGRNQELVVEVDLGEAASIDLDTPEALVAAGGELSDVKDHQGS